MTTTGTFDLVSALLRRGLLPREAVEAAADAARREGTTLQEILVSGGLVSEPELGFFLSEELGIPQVNPSLGAIDVDLVREFPAEVLRRRRMVPVFLEEGEVTVALSDPLDREASSECPRTGCDRPRRRTAASSRAWTRSWDRRTSRPTRGATRPSTS
jgi:hypothetical protein